MFKRILLVLAVPTLFFAAGLKDEGRRWWAHVQFLADDKLEGRNTGSEGYRKAAQYVAGEYERAGLKPAAGSGYFQPVEFVSRRLIENESSLALVRKGQAESLQLGEDANIGVRSNPPESLEAPLVFVGYGLSVPENNYDDLAGLDLRGKAVVYITGGPSSIPGPLRAHHQSADERWKALDHAGVVAALAIANPRSMDIPWARSTLSRLEPSMSLADPALISTPGRKLGITINPAHADKFLAGSGHTFQELLALADAGKPLPRFPIPATLRAKARVEHARAQSPNVVGVLPGSDAKLKSEYVVLSAHLDHVGVGQPINGDKIYNGAMDNASGIATLLEMAASLHESQKHLGRSVLFLAVTGEEKGLLGSRYYAARPTVNARSIVADINFDMFLPLAPLRTLTVYGLEESDLGEQVRAVTKSMGIAIQNDPEPNRNVFIRSDQYNFIREGIPALSFKVGYTPGSPEETTFKQWLHDRYHAPSDDLQQPVDLEAAAQFDRVMLALTEAVANRPERPRWNDSSFFRRFAK